MLIWGWREWTPRNRDSTHSMPRATGLMHPSHSMSKCIVSDINLISINIPVVMVELIYLKEATIQWKNNPLQVKLMHLSLCKHLLTIDLSNKCSEAKSAVVSSLLFKVCFSLTVKTSNVKIWWFLHSTVHCSITKPPFSTSNNHLTRIYDHIQSFQNIWGHK